MTIKYLAPLLIIAFLYATFNLLYYGGIIPVSGQIKMYWASIGGSVFGSPPQGLIDSIGTYFGTARSKAVTGPVSVILEYLLPVMRNRFILIFTVVLFAFGLIRRKTPIRPLFLFLVASSIIHTSYYALIGYVQTKAWYWVAECVTVILFIAIGFNEFFMIFRDKRIQMTVFAIIMLLVLVPLLPQYFSYMVGNYRFMPTDGEDYVGRVKFLEENTPENAIIGTPNAGGLGYFTDRHIINIDGLVHSYEFLESIKFQKSCLYLKRIGVNYIFIGPGYDKYEPYASMLKEQLEIVKRWTNANGERPHDLFRYLPNR